MVCSINSKFEQINIDGLVTNLENSLNYLTYIVKAIKEPQAEVAYTVDETLLKYRMEIFDSCISTAISVAKMMQRSLDLLAEYEGIKAPFVNNDNSEDNSNEAKPP